MHWPLLAARDDLYLCMPLCGGGDHLLHRTVESCCRRDLLGAGSGAEKCLGDSAQLVRTQGTVARLWQQYEGTYVASRIQMPTVWIFQYSTSVQQEQQPQSNKWLPFLQDSQRTRKALCLFTPNCDRRSCKKTNAGIHSQMFPSSSQNNLRAASRFLVAL